MESHTVLNTVTPRTLYTYLNTQIKLLYMHDIILFVMEI